MTVRDSRINGDENSGDILFSALVILDGASARDDTEQVLTTSRQVHCLDQLVDVVVPGDHQADTNKQFVCLIT